MNNLEYISFYQNYKFEDRIKLFNEGALSRRSWKL